MLFHDWLEAQYKSGRLDKEEFERGVDKLREKIDKEIDEERSNNLRQVQTPNK